MWVLFAILSLLMYAVTDIFAKNSVNNGNAYTPLELCVTVSILPFIISIAIYFFGFGESGMSPWRIIQLHPLIIVNLLCFLIYWIFYLLSMKFIKLSISEAVSGSTGVFYFIGLILINMFLGKLPAVHDMLHPLRLIPVILVLLCVFLYPSIEPSERNNNSVSKNGNKKKSRYIVGIFVLMLSLLVDSLDSLITTMIIDEGAIGIIDYIMTSYYFTIFPALLLFVFLRVKRGKWFIPLKNNPASSVGYTITAILSSQLFLVASYYDAIRTGILFIAYPVVPIIGAKVFLKERFTWRQNLCIWLITMSAIAFCIFDKLL